MQKMRIAYFGSPDFAAEFLGGILQANLPIELVNVFTQPDQPAGRKQTLTPTPVALYAEEKGLKVYKTQDTEDIVNALRKENIDLGVIFAFGKILPESVLTAPKYGFLNVHPSLLPKYRGTAPMAYPIMLGDTETGVTLIMLDDQMDHGPIIAQTKAAIEPNELRPQLEKKLTQLAIRLFKELLERHSGLSRIDSEVSHAPQNNKLFETEEQNHPEATRTSFLNKSHGFIPEDTFKKLLEHTSLSTLDIPPIISEYCVKYEIPLPEPQERVFYNLYRALYPWPGVWTFIRINDEQKRLKITEMKMEGEKLEIVKVQLEGKKETDWKTFVKAYTT